MQVKKQAQQEAELFESPVLEYGRMTTALKTALHKRHEKKITYMTAAHDLEAKKAHLGKLEGMGSDRPVRECIYVCLASGVLLRLLLLCTCFVDIFR